MSVNIAIIVAICFDSIKRNSQGVMWEYTNKYTHDLTYMTFPLR